MGGKAPYDITRDVTPYQGYTPQGHAQFVYGNAKNEGTDTRYLFSSNLANYADQNAWRNAKGGATQDWSKALFDLTYPEFASPAVAAAPAAAPAPAPAAPAPAPAAPAPAAPAAPAPIDPGGPVDPGLGSQLGGTVIDPPQYWVGGVSSYNNARSGKGGSGGTTGSIKTTQT
jgi:hypothetical protein